MSQDKSFDLRPAQVKELTFQTLAKTLKTQLGIQKLTKDVLLCLGLLAPKQGYTNAGALLADHNRFPGIELVRYGQNKKVILEQSRLQP